MTKNLDEFLQWFHSRGGTIDTSAVGFTVFPDTGRGIITLHDIPEDFTLFTIPHGLTLSTHTSTLPLKFGQQQWKKFGLNKGWAGLILCMMWEASLGHTSKWNGYLQSLPTAFDTPMFWNDEDLAELKGTAVVDKIGKAEAERDFSEKIVPAIKDRPDIFPEHTIDTCYTLERYHLMGSRILSRSFQIEDTKNGLEGIEADISAESMDTDTNSGSAMEFDPDEAADEQGDVDSNEEEDTSTITMVPMADMLNARYGCNNARLFDNDPTVLSMITTKPVAAGEQIWNTYGDLPNSDLLRRYGYVDVISSPDLGSPADIIEIPASLVVSVMLSSPATKDPESFRLSYQERIDWWLDEAGDDTFVVETDLEFPNPLISLIRLLLLSESDWKNTRTKQKLPKAKLDDVDGAQTLHIISSVAQKRLEEYPTTLEEDEILLSTQLSLNKQNAVYVRLGEKRILRKFMDKIAEMENLTSTEKKRKNGYRESTTSKRSKH